jgi:D-sedoheptulose 7-phosphate isomerase
MTFTSDYRKHLIEALSSVSLAGVEQAVSWLTEARRQNAQIFTCGNGGSASTASHFVCDILKGASFNRGDRFRILALTDNLATMTAYSNDVHYDCIFAEQLKNYAQPGDILIGISGSGNSPNVLRAFEYANSAGCRTIALTGRDGGRLGRLAQIDINVPVLHMGRIEDAHLAICHMIAYHFMEAEETAPEVLPALSPASESVAALAK